MFARLLSQTEAYRQFCRSTVKFPPAFPLQWKCCRQLWSWSRAPAVKFSVVLPNVSLPPDTGLKTVRTLPGEREVSL